jgi:UDP-N-acetylglucosamine--N-acetylmuramyl-(pentapeptide) pyrophosphoryl-undecaprenol N-acetylglucosamine transferase
MSTYIICCGGTGGHLSPGIAIAERLMEEGHECHLIISQKSIDKRLIQKYSQLKWISLKSFPFYRTPVKLLKFIYGQLYSLIASAFLLFRLKPCMVIGFGGYNCLGTVVMAFLLRIPIVLHEANHYPGKTTRLLAPYLKRLYVPEGVQVKRIASDTIRYYGYPLRKEIYKYDQAIARKRIGLEIEGNLLVVLGGSQGATVLTEWAEVHFEQLAHNEINLFCLSGMRNPKDYVLQRSAPSGKIIKAYFKPFYDDMAALLSSANLALTRSGAGTIAECVACQLPMILVPYPFAADDHQRENAKFVQKHGAGKMVLQDQLHSALNTILSVLNDTKAMETMSTQLKYINPSDSLDLIIKDLNSIMLQAASKHKKLS